MRLCVVLEQRFFGTSDGAVWTDGPCPCSFWVAVPRCFRRGPGDRPREAGRRCAAGLGACRRRGRCLCPGAPLPRPVGAYPQDPAPWAAVRQAVGPEDAVILRVSSNLAGLLFPALRRTGHPYAVEVLARSLRRVCPQGRAASLAALVPRDLRRALRAHCRHACAAAYVTAETLQRRYPAGPGTYCVHYSDVQIDGQIAQHPRGAVASSPCRLVLVGTLAQLYKAPEVLIDAVAHCARGGLDLRLTFVGDGKYRAELERGRRGWDWAIASVSAASSRPGKPSARSWTVRICSCSRRWQEGLPRAMIEAMARGLPCIGSTVGGIPELLPPEDMVRPDDAPALAAKIREVVTDPQRMARMSARNLDEAQQYREELLEGRRTAFYRCVRQRTEGWLASCCSNEARVGP